MGLKSILKENKTIAKIAIVSVVAGLVAVLWVYRFQIIWQLYSLKLPVLKRVQNAEKLEDLHPVWKVQFFKFVKELENLGYTVIITSGFRSFEKQEQLYNSGSTTAKAGRSYHNYGLATDINVITPEGTHLKMNTAAQTWQPVVEIAEKYGLRWGGVFSNFYDPIHFDFKNKYDIDDLLAMKESGNIINDKYIKLW